ncbi:amino acid permease [Hyphomicrobium methylovorum]|uniref:amino acid permease n=1 Tax=Hyphomicrobium methylovorum TaxID=84 RepID=UPI0015E71556|nr:amino acid permease [Hyphomicrobium methylovorum]MBA2127347.1 amino acid permease [Hyphomicrobium methylovorum]
MRQLFRKKPVGYDDSDFGLRRCLSAFDLTLLGVGAIIGTGIFVLTGHAAAVQSGPGVVLSFMVAGLACAFAALSYAELASSVGGCGSAYGYSYAAFGELLAWIIAWDLILEYGVSVAAVANGWSGYLNNGLEAIGFGLPEPLTRGPTALAWNGYLGGALEWFGFDPHADAIQKAGMGGIINLPAFLIIIALMVLLIIGVKESARINAAAVAIKLVAITIFIAVAVFNVNPENWSPFLPFGWFSHDVDGKPIGVLAGASIVFFAYVGFDAVSTAVEEAHDPQRSVPRGIIAALVFCTVIYVIVSALMTGIVPYTVLNVPSPASESLLRIGHSTAAGLVAAGVIAGLSTVMLVLYYALTRIIVGVSRDGLLPSFFTVVHPKTQTPVRTTVITGLVMATMAGFIPLGILAELVNIGTLAAFVMVCAGVIVLRSTHPDMPRPFKTPGGILLPICGVISCGALILFLPYETHLRFLGWLAVGLVIYFVYSIRNSKLATA